MSFILPLQDRLSGVRIGHILLLGFVLRMAWAIMVPVSPIADAIAYDMLAQSIATGQGYSWPDRGPTAYWPVGTSALYAGLYAVVGRDLMWVAVLNVLIGTALVFASYRVALTRFERSIALLAAALLAVWPTWIAFTTIISSELPWTLLVVGGLALFMGSKKAISLRSLAAFACLAAAAYFRPTILPLILMLPFIVALRARSVKALVLSLIPAVLVPALLIAPWAARNDRLFGEPVLMSTNFGVNLWIGNNPSATGGYIEAPAIEGGSRRLNEVQQDAAYKSRAVEFIVNNPGRYVRLCLERLRLTFDRETFAVAWNADGLAPWAMMPLKLAMTGYWWVMLALGLAGAFMALKAKRVAIYDEMFAAMGVMAAVSILVMASERYHYGMTPFIAIFAAYSLVVLLGRARRSAVPQ